VSIAYFALSLNTANLRGDAYFNCFMSALVEMPGHILSWVMFRWWSRRLSLFSTFFTAGLLLLFIQLIPAGMTLQRAFSRLFTEVCEIQHVIDWFCAQGLKLSGFLFYLSLKTQIGSVESELNMTT